MSKAQAVAADHIFDGTTVHEKAAVLIERLRGALARGRERLASR